MLTRRVGRSDLVASACGLGTFGMSGAYYDQSFRPGLPVSFGPAEDEESIRAIRCALDGGINFFDTADEYGCGHAERVLGQALQDRRNVAIIATKFGYTFDENSLHLTGTNASPAYIRQACEASLRRLKTGWIDLYLFHLRDYDLALAGEVLQTLEDLVQAGKIRWYGWSTDAPEEAKLFMQGAHCTAVQHWLNMASNTPEIPEMLALCEEYDQASINRSPLSSGRLTGKFNLDSTLPEDDWRRSWGDFRAERAACHLERIEAVRKLFAEAGDPRTLAQIALAWLWTCSERTVPIPGFKTLAQVRENIQAIEFGLLNGEQMRKIDEIFERLPNPSS